MHAQLPNISRKAIPQLSSEALARGNSPSNHLGSAWKKPSRSHFNILHTRKGPNSSTKSPRATTIGSQLFNCSQGWKNVKRSPYLLRTLLATEIHSVCQSPMSKHIHAWDQQINAMPLVSGAAEWVIIPFANLPCHNWSGVLQSTLIHPLV